MNRTCVRQGNRNKLALSCLMLLGLAVTAVSAQACTPGEFGLILSGAGGLMDDPIEEGARLPVGGSGRVTFLSDCAAGSLQKFNVSMNQTYVGEYGGIPTFAADEAGYVGAQVKVAGITIGSGGSEVEVPVAWNAGRPGPASVEVEIHYIAIRRMGVGTYYFGGSDDLFSVTDLNNGVDVPGAEAPGSSMQARQQAYCTFASRPPATLAMRDTPISLLGGVGSTGPATEFSFSWTCDHGNTGWTGGADFRYKSGTQVAGKPGRITAEGDDVSGIDLLITRRTTSGGYEPITFDQWYSNGRPLAESGTEILRVQFIRNDDALQPGDASGSMVVEVLMF
ncbi:hypothetical protein ACJ6WH_00060 [Stenotrophomonas maltophilia]|uniref:hypothetical protein n=1 Tax=Stenotrophomonas maltophilia TaxID=40324 RepID=UPI0013131D8F